MPLDDPVGLVTALITNRPLCMWCITEVTGFAALRVRHLLDEVEGHREAIGKCVGCGTVSVVMSSERQPSPNGHR